MGKSSKNEKKSKKKHKHKERKEKKKQKKLKKQKHKKEKAEEETKEKKVNTSVEEEKDNQEDDDDFAIPVDLMNSKSHAPETPEEYQQRQNRIRRETDPITGRPRLIKGDGEILEEIVSKDRHMAINKEATKGDGDYYQENTLGKLK